MLTIRTTEKGIYVSVDGKQEMAHPLGSLRYTCTSTSVRFFPANGYEGLYEGRYGDNFTVNGEPVTKENAQTLLEALFFLKDEGGGETLKTINGIALPGAGNIVLNQYIQHYKWTTNAATTRKQVPTTLRANGIKISYNDNSGVYHVEQYQSDDISDEAWGNDANWKGCRTPMTPMFEEAGATFNDETGFYEMKSPVSGEVLMSDLTECEMVTAYQYPRISYGKAASFNYSMFRAGPAINTHRRIRINFPQVGMFRQASELSLYGQTRMEVFIAEGISLGNPLPFVVQNKFESYGTVSLKRIIGTLSVGSITTPAGLVKNGDSLSVLEEIQLQGIKVNATLLSNTAVISLDSLSYLVENASNVITITITVHPEVYAKLTDEANAEWYAVNTAAQAKQIAFATTETAQVAMLAMRTLPEPQALDGELLAPAGCYLTQAEETPIENRLFLTRKVILPGEDVSAWRVATIAEKQEQDEYFASQLPEPTTEG